jgi:hypothetical protein
MSKFQEISSVYLAKTPNEIAKEAQAPGVIC